MKYLVLLFPLIAFSQTCPPNVDSNIETCIKVKCIRDDSQILNTIFGSKEKFITEISIGKKDNHCEVVYSSDWTGDQECRFPMKYLKDMSRIMGDSNSSEALMIFVAMIKLSKAKNKAQFLKANAVLNAYQNKMMSKQVEIKKFMDENPGMVKKIKNFCKQDESTGNAEKVAKYKTYMETMAKKMVKIQGKIQSKMNKYGN